MHFNELLDNRISVRKFQDKEVPQETINSVLYMANKSPSAGNLQARNVVEVRSSKKKDQLSEAAYGQASVSQAPVVLVVNACPDISASRYGERGRKLYAVQDATIFASYLQLAATSVGLDTVWLGAFDEAEIQAIVGLDLDSLPIALLPMGYREKTPQYTPRKPLDYLVYKRV